MDAPEKKYLEINDKRYAINIFIESRYGSRVSITNRGINIRVSKYLSTHDRLKQIDAFVEWAKEKIEIKLQKSPPLPPYSHGAKITFVDEIFELMFRPQQTHKKITCQLNVSTKIIEIIYPEDTKERVLQKNIGMMLNQLMSKYFLPMIEKRLAEFNQKFIYKKIKKVTLRNTSTRWGSCSHDGSISISTRLLFAPLWVLDYVLIHELCHLVHHNHSNKFWELVEQVYPHYKQAEKYLAEKGGSYNF
jgi:predicted metal-dependent hydrolase